MAPGEKVSLNAGNSTGSITSYAWVQTGGDTVTLTSANTKLATFTAPAVSDGKVHALTFQLTATGDGGASTDTCIVNVTPNTPDTPVPTTPTEPTTPASEPPVAKTGGDQYVNARDLVQLDGSGSYSPGGGELTYRWKLVEGKHVRLHNPCSETPTFKAPAVKKPVTLRFKLEVRDSSGYVATDTCVVNVQPLPGSSEEDDDYQQSRHHSRNHSRHQGSHGSYHHDRGDD